jgi:hypothetical protein
VSVSTAGVQANSYSEFSAVSADGRYVAFESDATNLVSIDANARLDVFLRDRLSGVTSLVSLNSTGAQGTVTRMCLRFLAMEGSFRS